MSHISIQKAKPFLRWAGGKTWLTKSISDFLPKEKFNNYHEPFLGGASIFFYLQPQKAFLSDLNPELINTYKEVKNNVHEVISELSKFRNTEDFYYKLRDTHYDSDPKRAARFIYLNQTSYNGIYRVNLKGEYNVPFGHRKKNFFDPENLLNVSSALSQANIIQSDFKYTIDHIKKNDFVFLDPPYTVTHNNNGFIKYNKKLFDIEDQYALSTFIDKIKSVGAYYILTNAAHEKIKEIFCKPGDSTFEVSRASLIGGKNAKRGVYQELIITNII